MMVLPSILQRPAVSVEGKVPRAHDQSINLHCPDDQVGGIVGKVGAAQRWDSCRLVDGHDAGANTLRQYRSNILIHSNRGDHLHGTDAERGAKCELLLDGHLELEQHHRGVDG